MKLVSNTSIEELEENINKERGRKISKEKIIREYEENNYFGISIEYFLE